VCASSASDARWFVPEGAWSSVTGFAPPDFLTQGGGSRVTLADWQAYAPSEVVDAASEAPQGRAAAVDVPALVLACVRADLDVWSGDLTPLAEERLVALASSTLSRMTGAGTLERVAPGPTAGEESGPVRSVHRASYRGKGELEGRAEARVVFGFVESAPRFVGCFAVCADDTRNGCAAVHAARTDVAFTDAPSPGMLLGSALWLVHHPRMASGLGATLVFASTLALLVTRPRARRRTS
jgi:hypothetical protein